MDLNVGSVIAHLKLDTSKFDGALKTSQTTMRQFSQATQRMGLYMTAGLTYPLYRLAKAAVKSFSTFNDAIIRAAAVTVGMNAEMRKAMEYTAIQMSKSSLFSATELAEGYFALGQAGYTAAQQINILPTVEQFATAATIDLDTAIRYLARTSEGLGMAMETPAEMMESMTQVSNAFTFAAITTTAEIEDFAVAMTHAAAPALKLVNKTMKEGISVLMAFARAGIVAEEAGTLLWTTVRDLQRANIKFRSEWRKFGIDVYDKSTRNMRNMADIFSDLEDKFNAMSDESKKASLQMLGFQDRSLRGIQALMGFSDEMKLFQKAMDDMGNLTERVADTYKKSFNAQMKMAKHNIEAMAISIGWILSPFLIKMNEQIKRLATWWESLSNGAKLLVIEIAGMVAVAGPLLFIFGKLLTTITMLSLGFRIAGVTILGLAKSFILVTLAASGWLLVVASLIAVGYTLRAMWKQNIGHFREMLSSLVGYFKQAFHKIANEIILPFMTWLRTEFMGKFKDFIADIGGLLQVISPVALVRKMIKGGASSIAAIFTEGRDEVRKSLDAIGAEVADVFDLSKIKIEIDDVALEATKKTLIEFRDGLKKQFGDDFKAVTDLITTKVKMMNEQFLKLLPEEDMLEIVIALDKVSKEISKIKVDPPPIERWDKFLDSIGNITERSIDVAINAFNGLTDTIATNLEQGIADWKAYGAAVLQEINRMIIGMMLAEGYKKALNALKFTRIKQEEAGMPAAIEAAGLSASASITTAGTTMSTAIITAGTTAAAAIYAAATGAAISSFFGGAAGTTGGGANATFNSTTIPKALGGAFDRGKEIMAFAKGGILNQPTLAPMALMGEAGPEAVMPLSRSASGELGVKATQPNINFNPQMKLIVVRDDREAALEAMRSPAGEKIIVQKAIRNRRTLG